MNDAISDQAIDLLRYLVGDQENGFGTHYGYLFCRCGYTARVPLDRSAMDLWTYAHNREKHWAYEDPWTTGLFLGVTYRTVALCLPPGNAS